METDMIYADIRSPSVPNHRRLKTLTKYYSYIAVDPSWVNQQYYALRLVSSTISRVPVKTKGSRSKPATSHITRVTEQDQSPSFDRLLRYHPGWNHLLPWFVASHVHVAVSQARAAATSEILPHLPIDPPGPFPESTPDDLHLQLHVATWTKQDNFTDRSLVRWGPDVAHHRGKRKCREKHLQRQNEKVMGRGQRNRALQREEMFDDAYQEALAYDDACDSVVYDPGWEWWWEDQYELRDCNGDEVGCEDNWYWERYYATIDKVRAWQEDAQWEYDASETVPEPLSERDSDGDAGECETSWSSLRALLDSDTILVERRDGGSDDDDIDMLSDFVGAFAWYDPEPGWDRLSEYSLPPG